MVVGICHVPCFQAIVRLSGRYGETSHFLPLLFALSRIFILYHEGSIRTGTLMYHFTRLYILLHGSMNAVMGGTLCALHFPFLCPILWYSYLMTDLNGIFFIPGKQQEIRDRLAGCKKSAKARGAILRMKDTAYELQCSALEKWTNQGHVRRIWWDERLLHFNNRPPSCRRGLLRRDGST